MKNKPTLQNLTDPNCYTIYDRQNGLCWILQPPLCELSKSNTGLSQVTLDNLRENLNTWADKGTKTFIVDDQSLGDYMLGENLTEFTERSIAFAVKLDLDRREQFAFMDNPCGYLFNAKDNLCSDVEVMGVLSFSPCSNKGNYSIDYCVINEKYRGKGLGSRTIKSFIENPEFFTYNRKFNTLFTSVRTDNVRCQKMLKNLGFKLSPTCRIGCSDPANPTVYHTTYKKVLTEEPEAYQ